jgi:hypothetical protein
MDSSQVFEKFSSILDTTKPGLPADAIGKSGETKAGNRNARTSQAGNPASAKTSIPNTIPKDSSGNAMATQTGTLEEEEKVQTWVPELKRLVEYKDLRDNTRVAPAEKFNRRRLGIEKNPDGPYKDYSIILRQIYGRDLRLREYRLELQSDNIRTLFRRIAKPLRSLDLDARPILIPHPFQALIYLRDLLLDLKDDAGVPEATRDEIKELLEFVRTEPCIKDVTTEYDALLPRRKITPALQHLLFRPGELVYIRHRANAYSSFTVEQCGYIHSIEPVIDRELGIERYKLILATGHHDGGKYFINRNTFWTFSSLSTELISLDDIDSLECVPMRLIPEDEARNIRQRLIARGKKYFEYCSEVQFLHYTGPAALSANSHAQLLGDFDQIGRNADFSDNWEVRTIVWPQLHSGSVLY